MVDSANSPQDLLANADPADVQATYCATLVDEWVRLGVRHAVVAPGSRSTPMAIELAARPDIAVHVVHDERVAGFTALGLGLAPGFPTPAVPALLLCTSGTAAANFFPAVVEAGLSEVPMIVLTADRPDELRGVGAPQTIDQVDLYGAHVRWSHDPGVPEAATAGEWRQLAATAWSKSARGPIQLNLAFREPLVGTPLAVIPTVEVEIDIELDSPTDPVPDGLSRERGLILAGGTSGVDPGQVVELSAATGWPIVADAMSSMRRLTGAITTVDALLRHEPFADEHEPDVIIRIGRPSTSKVLAQWSARPDVTLIQVGGPGRIDPAHNVAAICSIDDLLAARQSGAHGTNGSDWAMSWRDADRVARGVIEQELDADPLSEPSVARTLADNLPPAAQLTVSSSMPVRDLEWFGGHNARGHTNRGANGIDGVMSTALGRALGSNASIPGFVLIGDLAFVHDSNALVGLTRRDVDLRIIVVDNDGGGIFSFLPQRSLLAHERFEQLFGTPLGTDVLDVAAAHGIPTATAVTRSELIAQIGSPGPWVCRVPSNRAANVEIHARLNAAVAAAL